MYLLVTHLTHVFPVAGRLHSLSPAGQEATRARPAWHARPVN
ncbi:uncharacterized protein METZ01_LOCUS174107, partial [marine metagenome]